MYPIYKSNSGVCLSVVTNRVGQGQGRAGQGGQGGQGRHPPTGPAGGPQQPSGWSLCLWRRFWGVGKGRGRWSSGWKIGPSLSVTNLSLPHPPRWARSAWTPGPITDKRGALCTGFTLVSFKDGLGLKMSNRLQNLFWKVLLDYLPTHFNHWIISSNPNNSSPKPPQCFTSYL